MIEKLRNIYLKYKEIILYMVFGVITTVVNWAVYFPLYNFTFLSAYGTVCNAIAWVAAVAVAFLTNKPFVFESHDWSKKVVLPELAKFVSCRLFSFAVESVFVLVTIDLLHWNGNIMKVLISVVVVLINYIGSKLLFQKK